MDSPGPARNGGEDEPPTVKRDRSPRDGGQHPRLPTRKAGSEIFTNPPNLFYSSRSPDTRQGFPGRHDRYRKFERIGCRRQFPCP